MFDFTAGKHEVSPNFNTMLYFSLALHFTVTNRKPSEWELFGE